METKTEAFLTQSCPAAALKGSWLWLQIKEFVTLKRLPSPTVSLSDLQMTCPEYAEIFISTGLWHILPGHPSGAHRDTPVVYGVAMPCDLSLHVTAIGKLGRNTTE